jgi:hypothetical protein
MLPPPTKFLGTKSGMNDPREAKGGGMPRSRQMVEAKSACEVSRVREARPGVQSRFTYLIYHGVGVVAGGQGRFVSSRRAGGGRTRQEQRLVAVAVERRRGSIRLRKQGTRTSFCRN